MAFLNDMLSGFGGGKLLRGHVRSGDKLLAEGEPGMAQLCGIRARQGKDDSPDQHEFALAFAGTCIGCRQNLGEMTPHVRLGMDVPIRHDGEQQVIIDVPALGGDASAWGYKPLGEPPADGIDDDRVRLDKERRRAAEVTLTVVGAQRVVLLGMPTQNVNLRVRVEHAGVPPYEAAVERALVPFYASHLAEPGSRLIGLVRDDRPGKVKIDWPASAIADPGIGRPPAAVLAVAPAPEEVHDADEPQDWSAAALAAESNGDHDRIAGVDFDTWVTVEAGIVRDRIKPSETDAYAQGHGVPAGAWYAAQSGWQGRMISDPRVGARYGQAFQQAVKRR